MADDPNNPFARASAWPRMPGAPMRIGALPKAASRPEPARSITPVFTRPVGPAPPTLVERPTSRVPEVQTDPAPALLPPPPRRAAEKRKWTPYAAAAVVAVLLAGGSAVLFGRPTQPEPRLAAAVVGPAPARAAEPVPPPETPATEPRPHPVATVTRRTAKPSVGTPLLPRPEPPAIELGAPLAIPPVDDATPQAQAGPAPSSDPDAPLMTKPPY